VTLGSKRFGCPPWKITFARLGKDYCSSETDEIWSNLGYFGIVQEKPAMASLGNWPMPIYED
jgi:hypothetical protein